MGLASVKAMQLSETVIHMMFASKMTLSGLFIAGGVLMTARAAHGPVARGPRHHPAGLCG